MLLLKRETNFGQTPLDGSSQPEPSRNGQQTQTHSLASTLTLAVLTALVPVPVTTPGSPPPASPDVPCQLPSLKLLSAVAVSVTSVPGATHTFCVPWAIGAPFTETSHQNL